MLTEHFSTLYNDHILADMEWPRRVIAHVLDMSADRKFTSVLPNLVAVVDFVFQDGFDPSPFAKCIGEYEFVRHDRTCFRLVTSDNHVFILMRAQDNLWVLQYYQNSRSVSFLEAPANKDNEYRTKLRPTELGWQHIKTGQNVPLRVRLMPRNADERENMESEVSGDDDEDDTSSMVAENSDDGYHST